MKKIKEKIEMLDSFSVLTIKTEIILSIGYFIIAILSKSTINYADSLVLEINNITNFVKLGFINFFTAIIIGCIFDINLKKNKKMHKNLY